MVSKMKKCRKNAGFTLVELLTVVAILIILMAVAAINVIKYQRDLKGKESDSAAKEIFIAAQNHLTAANALGELSGWSDGSGTRFGDDEDHRNEYLIVYPTDNSGAAMWGKMLPFGAIDDHVRIGGSYVIHYNRKTATVLDVFYSDTSDSRFGVELALGSENGKRYSDLVSSYSTDGKRKERRNASWNGKTRRVIGWYGGASADQLNEYANYLKEPTIKVTNGDTLNVWVSKLASWDDAKTTDNASLSLIITGVSSGAMKEIKLAGKTGGSSIVFGADNARQELRDEFGVTLDDVTSADRKFARVMENTILGSGEGAFIPGEDLLIRAVAFDNTALSNIAESGTVQVNSLFGSLEKEGGSLPTDTTKKVDIATITSFRHLENLDAGVSSLKWDTLKVKGAIASDAAIGARQDSDLDWAEFLSNTSPTETSPDPSVYRGAQGTVSGCYLPVQPSLLDSAGTSVPRPLVYLGGDHIIRSVRLICKDENVSAGLFETLSAGSVVADLNLVNFDYPEPGTGHKAGALAGEATDTALINVSAYNDLTDDSALSISGSGSVGGLVGVYSGTANGCAAAVYVKSTGDTGSAGGLFGTVGTTVNGATLDGTVSNSYSGGHTEDGKYNAVTVAENNGTVTCTVQDVAGRPKMNVQGTTAGGLIGTLSHGTVTNCYSTCSVGSTSSTGTVGGFVGSVSSGCSVSSSYCTGLVAHNGQAYLRAKTNPPAVGLFAGSNSGTLTDDDKYLEIVNYIDDNAFSKDTAKAKIPAVGSGTATVNAFDNDTSGSKSAAENYDLFVRPAEGNNEVVGKPYDATVYNRSEKVTGGVRYPLRGLKDDDFTQFTQLFHYGDWPIYETYVVNS